MESKRIQINNKEKQFAAGNWGANKFVKKHTKIADPLFTAESKIRFSKRNRRQKKPFVLPWTICPFCGKKLEVADQSNVRFFKKYAKSCKACRAKEVPECPACKAKTWINSEGIYKHHPWGGCGFTGKKKSPAANWL